MEEKWTPVKYHKTDDGKIVFDCLMPEDGQEVFVTVRYSSERNCVIRDSCTIEYDIYENAYYFLDWGWDWCKDVIAWMPVVLPEPYKEE
jgi:hypothetical protein